jgi:hypothetical protein
MKLWSLIVLSLALCAAAPAVDLPFKRKQQEFQTRKPNEVSETLQKGTPTERNDLSRELGILAPVPGDSAAKPSSPCVDFTKVQERTVTLRANAENVVLVADSSACDSTYLVFFDKAPKSEWRHVQTVRLTARTVHPEVAFTELIHPGVSEIVVRHEVTRDSGSLFQQDFVVLKLLHDRVEVVLTATERSQITLANRKPEETDILQQTQKSTFDLLKSTPNSSAAYRILEKQVITDNKTTVSRAVLWTWNAELERFRPTPYDGGDAKPAPPAKKPASSPAKPPSPTPK